MGNIKLNKICGIRMFITRLFETCSCFNCQPMDVDTRCGGVRRLCAQHTTIHFLPRIQRWVLCCQPQMMKREVVIVCWILSSGN